MKSGKNHIFCVSIRKLLKTFATIDWPEYVENLKHEIQFLTKGNESAVENKIKN